MDPALQPRARNLYEKFANNTIAENHLMKALIKFYVGMGAAYFKPRTLIFVHLTALLHPLKVSDYFQLNHRRWSLGFWHFKRDSNNRRTNIPDFSNFPLITCLITTCPKWFYYVSQLQPFSIFSTLDVESTGSSNEFYDKFGIRYHISIILKGLWKRPIHRQSFILETK